jgi:hypothetical protein
MRSLLLLAALACAGCSALQGGVDWGKFGACVGNCLTAPQPASCASCVATCAGVAPADKQAPLAATARYSAPCDRTP